MSSAMRSAGSPLTSSTSAPVDVTVAPAPASSASAAPGSGVRIVTPSRDAAPRISLTLVSAISRPRPMTTR
jgi:hypothetical protein